MTSFEVVPINFTLTKAAVDEIERLTLALEAERKESYLPSFTWQEEYEEAERRVVDRGFAFGWYEASTIPAEAVQVYDRLRIVFAIEPKRAEKFKDRTIDFDGERLVFATEK